MTAASSPLLPLDPVALAQALIRCASVTPADAGAQATLVAALAPFGFHAEAMPFSEPGTPDVDNLYLTLTGPAPTDAAAGTGAGATGRGRHFCFAGHSDVVPPGQASGWSAPPFSGEILGDALYGRGAVDMKGGIAAFAAAAASFVAERGPPPGKISLLITGDEEGPSINGTKKMLAALAARGEILDACVVGEPTATRRLGDMMKIGRRGSLNGYLTVLGAQGHVAYPDRADNPIPKLLALLAALGSGPIDAGNDHFQPSNLEITTIDVGNPTVNLIPAQAAARFNVRYNTNWTGASLESHLRAKLDAVGIAYDLTISVSGDAFLTPPGPLSDLAVAACQAETGRTPDASTSGGTSDARFIKDYCPVIELGLVGHSMHKVDEQASVTEIVALSRIYRRMLDGFFAS